MSEVMLHGVLKMPSTMWHEDSPIDNMQRQARYFEASELIYKQADKIAELEKERDEYHAMVVYMGAIMDESEGVAGYHLNGDVAKWDDLFTESLYKDAASVRDLEQQAVGVSQVQVILRYNDWEDDELQLTLASRSIELNIKAKALKGQEQANGMDAVWKLAREIKDV